MKEIKPLYRRGGLVFSFLQAVLLRRIPAPGIDSDLHDDKRYRSCIV